jgi:hypothetical protein
MPTIIKTTLFILLFGTFRECVCNVNGEAYKIKERIANFGDKQLPLSSVSLKKDNGYYIGHQNGETGNYFLAFSLHQNDTFQVCQIFSNRNWDKNNVVNNLIIKAATSLDSSNFKFDTIYDEADSISIMLLNSKTNAILHSVSIKNINDIVDVNKYKPLSNH